MTASRLSPTCWPAVAFYWSSSASLSASPRTSACCGQSARVAGHHTRGRANPVRVLSPTVKCRFPHRPACPAGGGAAAPGRTRSRRLGARGHSSGGTPRASHCRKRLARTPTGTQRCPASRVVAARYRSPEQADDRLERRLRGLLFHLALAPTGRAGRINGPSWRLPARGDLLQERPHPGHHRGH